MSSFKIIRQQNSLLSQLSNLSGHMFQFNGSSILNPSLVEVFSNNKHQEISLNKMSEGSIQIDQIINKDFKKQNSNFKNIKWIIQGGQNIQGVSQEEELRKQVQPVKQTIKKYISKKKAIKKKRRKRGEKTKGQLKNQTKNIPKNFGKATIAFMEKKSYYFQSYFKSDNFKWTQFIKQVTSYKNTINTIADLRKLWVKTQYSKQIRVFSNFFLRKHGYSYVFNSRISNISVHLKYRRRLLQALIKPQQFKHIKDY